MNEIPTHTDEARALLAAGELEPGDKALDVPIDSMTDREILAEILVHERRTRDALNEFISGVTNSPLGAMMKTGGPFAAMMNGGNKVP